MPKPTIGRIVLYVMSEQDTRLVNERRAECAFPQGINMPQPGDILPLIICRAWPPELYGNKDAINGQVMLDGSGTLWKTSVHPDAEKTPGTWHWPEIKPTVVDIKTMRPLDSITRLDAELLQRVTLSQLELRMRRLCGHIETLGASPALTYLSVECSNTHQVLAALVEQTPLSPYHTDWLNGDHE